MTYFDYVPRWEGAVIAPESGGTMRLTLYSDPARSQLVAVCDSVRQLLHGPYRFSVPHSVAAGRYWATVQFTAPATGQAVVDQVRADLPSGSGFVTTPEQVADHLGTPLPLPVDLREEYLGAIEEAQADVEAYLGRRLVPQAMTLTGVVPCPGIPLTDARAWPLPPTVNDTVMVTACSPLPDGSYRVDVLVGLDGAATKPIRRFVAAHAAEALRTRSPSGEGRRVSSVSADGQSVSYEASARPGEPGALPVIESLRRYRRAAVYQSRRGAHAPMLPYGVRW